ncbi:TonB-dependent receptor domain-containing protein [Parvularcula maris]|uniref:TonB-dependent receptor n=1 Tax=Parvularcula maris TaxID=2965077 RepID=A0A9X2L8R3_9PROT|nr:TonB-dependent receptor [Parvularcula maris]MCQ8185051.1 TonB-dependent receptor [Parvularcula maris]
MLKQEALVPSALLAIAMFSIAVPAAAQDSVAETAVDEEDTADTDTDSGDVIVVRGAFVPDEKRSTSEISSLLDAEDFVRTGDADIAGALRRITGISISGGKFPVARGLNERYASTTINGVPLPSPEPLRRAAPLDLIPTRILSGTTAQKTFSPQFSGEFGGAAIDLQTVGVPDEGFFVARGSLSIDTESNFREGLFFEGSDTDRFGFDDGLRDLPDLAAAAAAGEDFDPIAVSQSFNHSETALITTDDIPINGGGSFTGGTVFVDNSDVRVGGTIYAGYNNQWQRRDAIEDRSDEGNAGQNDADAERYEETRQEVSINALGTLGVEIGSDHEIGLTSFLLRSSLKRARLGSITDEDEINDAPGIREFTDFVERQVWQSQLNGEHFFPALADLTAKWRVSYGEASRDAPYERTLTRVPNEVTYTDGSGVEQTRVFNQVFIVPTAPTFNEINFSTLDDTNFYAAADFELPFTLGEREIKLGFGASYADTERETARQTFFLGGAPSNPDFADFADVIEPFVLGARTDVLFDDEIFELGLFQFAPFLSLAFPDSSEASLEVISGYGLVDFELNDYLRFSAGVRYEDGEETATAFQTGSAAVIEEVIDEDFLLPAVTVTWNPLGNLQLRAGFSQTIARPQFRELVPTVFTDPEFSVEIVGNPFLENSELDNFDVRGEYYFRNGEFITLGAFYKDIENPIERAFVPAEGDITTFVNAPAAQIWGIEFEFEKRFDLIDWGDLPNFVADKTLILNTNYTFSQSELDVSDDDQIIVPSGLTLGSATFDAVSVLDTDRSLVGQSDHLFNFQLGLENPDTNFRATLLLNFASDRILFGEEPTAGGGALPSVIEDVPTELDFVFGRNFEVFDRTLDVGFSVRNILGEEFNAFRDFGPDAIADDNPFADGVVPFLAYDRGRIFNASLSVEF